MMTLESIKVEDLKVKGCEELVSLWRTEWGWLVPLRYLRNLELRNCPQFVSTGGTEEKEKTELFQNFTCLTVLKIVNWPKLVSFSADNLPSTVKRLVIEECETLVCLLEDGENINFSSTSLLESLRIDNCKALKSLSSSSKLLVGLKSLVISKCENLVCLLEDRENINFISTSLLESLEITGCKVLKSLSSNGKLPLKLKTLEIRHCPVLELVAQEIGDNNCLESIQILYCKNIQYLPQGIDKLKSLHLYGCENLEALPSLYSLQCLTIADCPRVTSIPEGVLPTTLTDLNISGPNIIKAVTLRRLHTLESLTSLFIYSSDDVSFPPEGIKLPSSLQFICIDDFKNLRKLSSKGFQHLSSLRSLRIKRCPKLKSLPKKEMLPSLLELEIYDCPELKKRCERTGKYWSYIADIQSVSIDENDL